MNGPTPDKVMQLITGASAASILGAAARHGLLPLSKEIQIVRMASRRRPASHPVARRRYSWLRRFSSGGGIPGFGFGFGFGFCLGVGGASGIGAGIVGSGI
jgi:hypothetical protein